MKRINDLDVLKTRWVFFDFFDTVVHRNCSPSDVKKMWAVEIKKNLGLSVSCEELFVIRLESEIELERNSNRYGEFTYQELCEEVYYRIKSSFSDIAQISPDKFVEICLKIEQKVECSVQYVDEEILAILKSIYQKNVKIAIVSDFYLSKNIIRYFLEEKKIAHYFAEIFVSCDWNCNKRKGELFEVVCNELNIGYEDCIMIGDNRTSDYLIPKRIGIKAYYKKTEYSEENLTRDAIISKLKRIAREEIQVPYSNYAFLLFLFVERLNQKLQDEGFREVYFLAREGEFLNRIFELYQNYLSEDCRVVSKYLYVSRVATYVPTLKSLENEKFNTIFREYPNIDIEAFLGSVGFENEDIKEIIQEIGLFGAKAVDSLERLKSTPAFKKKYDAKRKKQKELLKQYLHQEGIEVKKERIAIVDVGWKGTIQDNLFKVMDGEIDIYGYYIGVTGKTCFEARNHKEGLIFSKYPRFSKNYDVWNFDKTFLERLLYASHPSTNKYNDKNGRVIPSMKKYESEEGIYDKISLVQNAIERKFERICGVFNHNYLTADKLLSFYEDIHLKTIFLVNKKELKLQRELLNAQYENFGYNTSYGENSKKAFALNNIIKKIKENYRRIKSVELVSRVLLNKRCYWGIRILYYFKYVSLRAKKVLFKE